MVGITSMFALMKNLVSFGVMRHVEIQSLLQMQLSSLSTMKLLIELPLTFMALATDE